MSISDGPRGPTVNEVEERLVRLIQRVESRESAARWALTWVAAKRSDVADRRVWDALVAPSGADLASADRESLHDEKDFATWLDELRGSTA